MTSLLSTHGFKVTRTSFVMVCVFLYIQIYDTIQPLLICVVNLFTLELADAENKYQEKIQSKESNKAQFDAGWKVEELKRLVDSSQQLIADVSIVIQLVSDPGTDVVHANVALRLDCIRKSVSSFTKDLSRHQRVRTTHIFVMMISCEQRNVKRYALPVQCLPYHSINQQVMRRLMSNLLKEMIRWPEG